MRRQALTTGALLLLALSAICVGCTQSGQDAPANSSIGTTSSGDVATTGGDVTAPSGSATGTPAPLPPAAARGAAIVLEGRFDTVTNPNAPIMGWAGSQIRIGFSGTSLAVKFAAYGVFDGNTDGTPSDNYIVVSIDESALSVVRLKFGTSTYNVATGLTRGQHEATIIKRTEGEFGTAQFVGATTDGALTTTIPALRRRIEVIGDSGATGWGAAGVLGDANACATLSGAQDVTLAYPLVAAKLLGAQVHNTSYAGKGLVQNRDMENDSYKTLPRLWTRRLPNSEFSASEAWDPNSWSPDALILVTSGNDFFANGGPNQATYQDTISAFIKTLRQTHPASHVYLMVSPMLHNVTYSGGGYTPTARNDAIAWCKNVISGLGDKNTHYLDIAEDNGEDLSCDYHMTPATHLVVAKTIAASLATDLGWSN